MRVENYKLEASSSNEIARFDVYLDKMGIILHQFRVVKKKDHGWFISPPNYSIEENGVKKWHPYVTFSEQRKKEFYDMLHDLVKEKMGNP